MGLDAMELVMESEKRFKVKLDMDAIRRKAQQRRPPDVTAEEFLRTLHTSERHCPDCEYDLRGHAPGVRCPECGKQPEPITWEAVRSILARIANMDEQRIQPTSRLFADLGLS